MRIQKLIGSVLVLMLFHSTLAVAAKSPWTRLFEASVQADDNISRSQFGADIEEDTIGSTGVSISYTNAIGKASALTVTGGILVNEFADFDGLSETRGSITADYRFQLRNGFAAPIYSTFLRATFVDSETDNRDGFIWDLGFTSTKRLTTTLTGTLGVTATRRTSDDGIVFDMDSQRYFGNLDLALSDKHAVYLTYNFFDGDVFSTSTPTLNVFDFADAVEADPAFGGVANQKFIYRLDAQTQILRLGFNLGLSRKQALDFSADFLSSDAAGPNEYDRTTFTLSYFYRF